jgi:hypothetical protein
MSKIGCVRSDAKPSIEPLLVGTMARLEDIDPVGSRNSSWLPSNPKRLGVAASLGFPIPSNFLTIGGIDVVAVRDGQLRLIQCKHTQWSARVNEDVILEMLSAFDAYRSMLIATARSGVCRPVLVTNGLPTKLARGQAKERDVDIISCQELAELLRSIPCTLADIELMEQRRLSSLAAVRSELQQMGVPKSSGRN